MYRSTDAGETWTHLGLDDARHIARIVIDPRNPDRVFVAAMGHASGKNAMRGVYRSNDGGKSWQRVLFGDDSTGAGPVRIPDSGWRNGARVSRTRGHAAGSARTPWVRRTDCG